jgi:uncharacterized protein YifN (PemK superfamily)
VSFVIGNIKRGDILECNFGNYKEIQGEDGEVSHDRSNFDTRIPNEMRKTRPIVVIGEHKGQYLVVPISSTEDTHNNPRKTGAGRGFHIVIDDGIIPVTHFYMAGMKRWAKANMVQAVDRHRLSNIYCKKRRERLQVEVPVETLRAIQEALIKAIGRPELLL